MWRHSYKLMYILTVKRVNSKANRLRRKCISILFLSTFISMFLRYLCFNYFVVVGGCLQATKTEMRRRQKLIPALLILFLCYSELKKKLFFRQKTPKTFRDASE
ncbi:hypothetical protein KFK09_013133 [Dendrobium nobile]|uniref:Uncharacterized protein n=1 Tax=Dendrobium nobile TaxID=94219 RepID=A0A8T3B7V2_DENNO|nr:hypothetical protein KFK09_013131 [Dendrobium nobile]KAI0507015.1 hypothetical protein KFK09_013133 [Dendrobium nobile]